MCILVYQKPVVIYEGYLDVGFRLKADIFFAQASHGQTKGRQVCSRLSQLSDTIEYELAGCSPHQKSDKASHIPREGLQDDYTRD